MDQKDLCSLSEEEVSNYRNQTVGFVFQAHHLLPSCTVLENVMIPGLAGFGGKVGRELTDRANQLLEEVGLGHRTSHLPSQISGCLLYTSPSPRDLSTSRMPSSA